MKFLTAMVLHKSLDWIKTSIPLYRKYFKEPLLVVNNSNDPKESQFATGEKCVVIENRGRCMHGDGVDKAVEYCRKHKIEGLVLIEPDCLINGDKWYQAITEPIKHGYWMAGTVKLPWGPIHPCPSAWNVNNIKFSFNATSRLYDAYHPKFLQLFNLNLLINILAKQSDVDKYGVKKLLGEDKTSNVFWLFMWDTGMKNWFEAAINNKAIHVSMTQDFKHLWHGNKRNPNNLLLL
jgi:hypothetical protein